MSGFHATGGYGPGFARVYNLKWGGFAKRVAPRILEYYESRYAGPPERSLLDLCCGTGQLALHFLEHGYRVIGLDISESMLTLAGENLAPYISRSQALLARADASSFLLSETLGLVVSTFDSMNHLDGLAPLRGCFQSVFSVLRAGGYFIFDLNTRRGLKRWNCITVEDTDEILLVNHGIFDGLADRAQLRISGFLKRSDGLYDRFEEHACNTVFELETVRESLLTAGWAAVHFARETDLSAPVEFPEEESRIFVVARKAE